jgi:hypothetical protein
MHGSACAVLPVLPAFLLTPAPSTSKHNVGLLLRQTTRLSGDTLTAMVVFYLHPVPSDN